jgi:hypothetical protein
MRLGPADLLHRSFITITAIAPTAVGLIELESQLESYSWFVS